MNITFVNTKKVTKQLPHGRTWPFPTSIGGTNEAEKLCSIGNAQGSKEREPSSQGQKANASWQPPKEYRYGD